MGSREKIYMNLYMYIQGLKKFIFIHVDQLYILECKKFKIPSMYIQELKINIICFMYLQEENTCMFMNIYLILNSWIYMNFLFLNFIRVDY